MLAWPVIVREIRSESRNPVSYWVRSFGAAAMLLPLIPLLLHRIAPGPGQGLLIFHELNTLLFWAIWLLVPGLTADCISRERREGTLGLLFLTPMQPREISLGKCVVSAWRGLTIWLAVIPVMVLPLLMGGVSRLDVVSALATNAGAFLLALSAGVLASSYCRKWNSALMLALLFSLGFWFVFSASQRLYIVNQFMGRTELNLSPVMIFHWHWIHRGLGTTGKEILDAALWGVMGGALMFVFVIFLAARRMEKYRREEPPSARQLWWRRIFCTPILWQNYYRKSVLLR
jgi:ABC-type transport system involved in multi-copper enzyme maturation permease subunit